MERGLIWLPLLALFIGLAWAGWREYQKVEAYENWAQQFDRAKYDIYAVLGQKNDLITWGKPTRKQPQDLQTFSLKDVSAIELRVEGSTVSLEQPPSQGKPSIHFDLHNGESIDIPFTQISLATQWTQKLQELANHSDPK